MDEGGRNIAALCCTKTKTRRRPLRILANQLIPFYMGSPQFLKIIVMHAMGNFKNQRGVGVP
jgi:hypothetical protein